MSDPPVVVQKIKRSSNGVLYRPEISMTKPREPATPRTSHLPRTPLGHLSKSSTIRNDAVFLVHIFKGRIGPQSTTTSHLEEED